MPNPTLQTKTAEDLCLLFGLKGYHGVTYAADGSVNTQLDISVAAGAFAVFKDGTIMSSELASTTIPGNSTNGSYTLYLDYAPGAIGAIVPVWTVATSTTSTTAITVGTVTVASGAISAVTPATALGTWTF